MVRDPVSRCLSLFYFKVTRGTATNTEEAKLDFVKEICRNNQYLYLRTNDTQDLEEEGRSDHEVVQHLLSQYSFMGTSARTDRGSRCITRHCPWDLTARRCVRCRGDRDVRRELCGTGQASGSAVDGRALRIVEGGWVLAEPWGQAPDRRCFGTDLRGAP
eukprot:scaffold207_cov409-Prasinococcus_capsulatus_cf.AAC.55